MLRQQWGSVVCPSCGNLVGVKDERCFTCGRWNLGLWGFAPLLNRLGRDLGFTQFVMWSCIILYLLTLASDVQGVSMSGFNFLSPSVRSLFLFGASGVVPVFRYGRWWTFLTAGWLHAGALHILFNMMWIRQLAPATSEMYGASRMVIIYTIAGVAGRTGFRAIPRASTGCGQDGQCAFAPRREGRAVTARSRRSPESRASARERLRHSNVGRSAGRVR